MSDEEDYMSNDFLAKVDDVKPGISACRANQRMFRINANREFAEKRQRREKPATKAEIERNRLEEGINKPIDSESKGFKLLQMMGYKPGMSLGQKREGKEDGIKEPIPMQMKATRSGVGHEQEMMEKQRERCEAHMEVMQRRARMEEDLADDFQTRRRLMALQKRTISDIQKTRKACQEMDIRLGKEEPEEFWFWPIYASRRQQEEEETAYEDDDKPNPMINKKRKLELLISKEEEEDEGEVHFYYSTGRMAPMADVNFFEMTEKELAESLERVIDYMRIAHFYCIWCGCSYEDETDLGSNCPGQTRDDHDS